MARQAPVGSWQGDFFADADKRLMRTFPYFEAAHQNEWVGEGSSSDTGSSALLNDREKGIKSDERRRFSPAFLRVRCFPVLDVEMIRYPSLSGAAGSLSDIEPSPIERKTRLVSAAARTERKEEVRAINRAAA